MERVIKQNVSTQSAMKILKKFGTDINEDEAKLVLNFLYKMANIAVSQYLRK